MSSNGSTHWCYSCRQSVTLQGRNGACAICMEGFVQELEDIVSEEDPYQRPRFIEAVSNFLRQRIASQNNYDDEHRDWGPENANIGNPFLIFSGDMPVRVNNNGGLSEFLNEALGFRRENGGNYFVGPGVEELFEQITSNDHRVPPPASRSSIDALPTTKISKKHVRADLHCAICKEKFELGSLARKLPCKHIYHSDCIAPWLEQRSSCPVCRKELTVQRSSDGHRERRNIWSFLWPFGSSYSNSHRNGTAGSSTVTSHQDIQHTGYSNWPFD